jgi:hypothetical protein
MGSGAALAGYGAIDGADGPGMPPGHRCPGGTYCYPSKMDIDPDCGEFIA